MEVFTTVIGFTGYFLEAVGVIIILVGSIWVSINVASRISNTSKDTLFHEYRLGIGRIMMLGLEFLVAGDIIRTVVVAHSLIDVVSLGLIVLIRTLLVFTIHLEVEGRWPWQPAPGNTQAKAEDHQ